MFLTLCVLSGLAYGLQGALMVSVYRRLNALHGVALRGLCLGITMLPLVLFSTDVYENWAPILPFILIAAICSAAANYLNASAFSHLNAGTVTTTTVSMSTAVITLISAVVVREPLTFLQIFCLFVLLISNACLAAGRSSGAIAGTANPGRGFLLAASAGAFGGVGAGLVGMGSRYGLPFASGYLWESMVGFITVGIACMMRRVRGEPKENISFRDFLVVLVFSSGTIIGTGAFAYASTLGPLGIAGGIAFSFAMIFIAIFSAVFYKEHLRPFHWAAVAVAALAVVAMKA